MSTSELAIRRSSDLGPLDPNRAGAGMINPKRALQELETM
jgi:hypothetical protein